MDSEYILRIVLRARDELATALGKARAQIKGFADDVRKADRDMEGFNKRVTSANTRLGNLNKRIDETRGKLRSLGGDSGDIDLAMSRGSGSADALSKDFDRVGHSADRSSRSTRVLAITNRDVDRSSRGLSNRLDSLAHSISSVGDNVATFDNKLRGLLVFAIFAFAEQLTSSLVALGGELTAVAASAAQAGVALGGMLVAGIAQALPMVGLLVGAFQRVGKVWEAVQTADKVQQQTFQRSQRRQKGMADSSDQLASAQDSLVSANERVTEAHRNVGIAEERAGLATRDLTKARREGRRELQDLVLAEQKAAIAAKGAAISQTEAQRSLRNVIQSGGSLGDVQRGQLDIASSRVDRRQADIEARRAREDRSRARREGGVEGLDSVEASKRSVRDAERGIADARRGVVDAERAVTRAERGLQKARRGAADAAKDTFAAASQLEYLLGRLSPAERRLYASLQRIRITWKKEFRGITDTMIGSFTHGVNRVNALLKDRRIQEGARGLSRAISSQFNRITDTFTSGPIVSQFLRIAEAGRKNLKPLGDIAINLGKSFLNIAETAGPALHRLVLFIRELSERFLGLTGNKDKMTDFFLTGEKHFESWVKLGIAVLRLFGALMGAGGAKEGKNTIDSMTTGIDKMTAGINKNREGVAKFFKDAREATGEIFKVLKDLSIEIIRSFRPESVRAFGQVFRTVIIPALGTVIRTVGAMTTIFAKFLSIPGVSTMAKLSLSFVLFGAVVHGAASSVGLMLHNISAVTRIMSPLGRVLSGNALIASKAGKGFAGLGAKVTEFGGAFTKNVRTDKITAAGAVSNTFGMRVQAMGARITKAAPAVRGAAAFMFGPWGLLIAAAVVGIVLLMKHFGKLDDVGRALKRAWEDIKKSVAGPLKELDKALGGSGKNMNQLKKVVNDVGKVFTNVFVKVLIFYIKDFARTVGAQLGGAIRVLAGLTNILKGLFTLNPRLMLKGLGQVLGGFASFGKGIVLAVTRPVRLLGTVLLAPFKKAWEAIKDFFGVSSPSRRFINLGHAFVDGIKAGLRALGGAFVSPFVRSFNKAKEAFASFRRSARSTVNDVIDFFKKLPGKLKDFAVDAVHAVGKAFKGLGKMIIDAIVEGIKRNAHLVKKVFEKIVPKPLRKLLGKAGGAAGEVADFLNPFQHGGPVGRGYGGGDQIPIAAERGEHMWTKEEVKGAGGHAAVMAIRRVFAGGGARSGVGKMARGGEPKKSGRGDDSGGTGDLLDKVLASIARFGDDALKEWRNSWHALEKVADTRSDNIYTTVTRRLRRMRNRAEDEFEAMRKSGRRQMGLLEDDFRESISSIQRNIFIGMDYVGDATNKALSSFGGREVKLRIPRPRGLRKAVGGVVGAIGERGKDAVNTWLGRGEMVLNWAHQKYIQPAMHAFYGHGLGKTFDRVKGTHAGTMDGAPGFARGRGGSHYDSLIDAANKVNRAGFPYSWGGGHTQPSRFGPFDCSGAVSYVTQQAGYNVPTTTSGGMGGWPFPKGSGRVTVFYNPGHTFMRIGSRYFGTSGFARPNGGAGWFNQAPSRNYLSGFNTIHLTGLGGKGARIDDMSSPEADIPRIMVAGPLGIARKTVQATMDRVRKAAGRFAQKQLDRMNPGGGQWGDINVRGYKGPLNKIFPRHSAGEPGIQLSPRQVEGLASRAGLPGRTFEQIAHGESNYRPGVVSNDGGYGLWQNTPRVWGASALGFLKRLGGIRQLLNPWRNALMAKFLYDSAGKSIRPWYGTKFVTNARRAIGGIVGKFARGGEVHGVDGSPVPILAHAREWILNMSQQTKLARLIGVGRNKLKSMLGFMGGRGSFAGGGEVISPDGQWVWDEDRQQWIPRVSAAYAPGDENFNRKRRRRKNVDHRSPDARPEAVRLRYPRVDHRSPDAGLGTPVHVRPRLGVDHDDGGGGGSRRGGGGGSSGGGGSGGGGGGAADRAGERRAQAVADRARKKREEFWAKWQEKIDKLTAGGLDHWLKHIEREIRKLSSIKNPTQRQKSRLSQLERLRNMAIDSALEGPDFLVGSFSQILRNMKKINVGFKHLSVKSDKFFDQFLKGIDTISGEGGIIDALEAARQRTTARLGRGLTFAMTKLTGGRRGRAVQQGGESAASNRALIELENARKQLGQVLDEEPVVRKALRRVRRQLARLRKGGVDKDETANEKKLVAAEQRLLEQYNTVRDAHAEALEAFYNAQVAQQQAVVDEINNRYTRQTTALDMWGRVGTALGKEDWAQKVSQLRRGALEAQAKELEGRINAAKSIGNTEMANQLTDQIQDLRVQIVELIQQELTAAMDSINNAAQRRLGRLDLFGRMADALGTVGLSGGVRVAGETLSRGSVFARRQQALESQRSGLQGVLRQAQGQGNIGLIQQLTDQLAELSVAIAENTKALFTARVEEANARASYALGINDLNRQIGELENTLAGTDASAQLLALAQERSAILETQRADLQALLDEARAKGDQAATQDLTQQLLENRLAVLQNTQSLNELTGATTSPQGFSSTSWQWFREAIFNGMGGLLPEYQIPQMPSSLAVNGSGLLDGTVVSMPMGVGRVINEGDTNIYVDEAEPGTDPEYLAGQFNHKKRTSGVD